MAKFLEVLYNFKFIRDAPEGFDLHRTIDIRYSQVVGMGFPHLSETMDSTGVGQRATRFQIRDQDLAGKIDDLGWFGHKMYPAKKQNFCIGFGGFSGQLQAVTHIVCRPLYFRSMVVIDLNHGIFCAFRFTGLGCRGLR